MASASLPAPRAAAAPISASCETDSPPIFIPFPGSLPNIDLPGLDNYCVDADIRRLVSAVNANRDRITVIQLRQISNILGRNDVSTILFRVEDALPGLQATTADHAARITVNTARLADHDARIANNAAALATLSMGVTDLRDDLDAGLAMANAMEVFAPDPGAHFRLTVGLGTHGGTTAIGITGTGRVESSGASLYLGMAGIPGRKGDLGAKAGVSFAW